MTHLVANVLAAIYFRIFWVIHHQTTFGEVIQSTLSRGVTRHKVLSYLLSPLLRTFYNLLISNLIFLKKQHCPPSLKPQPQREKLQSALMKVGKPAIMSRIFPEYSFIKFKWAAVRLSQSPQPLQILCHPIFQFFVVNAIIKN